MVEELGQFDVLLGRGIGPNEHSGNIRYRTIVQTYQKEYLATNKRKEKERIAKKAIAAVEANGARFLRQIDEESSKAGNNGTDKKATKNSKKRYTIAEKEIVLEKTKQSLRFQGHNKNKAVPTKDRSAEDDCKVSKPAEASPLSASITEAGKVPMSFGPLHQPFVNSQTLAGLVARTSAQDLNASASVSNLIPGSSLAATASAANTDALLAALRQHGLLSSERKQNMLNNAAALLGPSQAGSNLSLSSTDNSDLVSRLLREMLVPTTENMSIDAQVLALLKHTQDSPQVPREKAPPSVAQLLARTMHNSDLGQMLSRDAQIQDALARLLRGQATSSPGIDAAQGYPYCLQELQRNSPSVEDSMRSQDAILSYLQQQTCSLNEFHSPSPSALLNNYLLNQSNRIHAHQRLTDQFDRISNQRA